MGVVHAKEAIAAASSSSSSSSPSLQDVGAVVRRVYVDGVDRTKEDVVLRQVRDVFKAQHFEEMLLKAQDCKNNLQGT